MTEHTPGPWRIAPASAYRDASVINIDSGERGLSGFVATVGVRGDARAEADACLIAAAPDMLEALKAVVAVADRKAVEFDRAHAAIAKATGEKQT